MSKRPTVAVSARQRESDTQTVAVFTPEDEEFLPIVAVVIVVAVLFCSFLAWKLGFGAAIRKQFWPSVKEEANKESEAKEAEVTEAETVESV